eukprot:COSAG01_NODE_545_length_15679_cov_68.030167_2_plen_174_part_00
MLWSVLVQARNSKSTKDAQHRSTALWCAHLFVSSVGLFCVTVTLVRAVSWYAECQSSSEFCSLTFETVPAPHGSSTRCATQSISHRSSIIMDRNPIMQEACNLPADEKVCTCTERSTSGHLAVASMITMSYFTVWAVFVKGAPSIATSISSAEVDILTAPCVDAAATIARAKT